MSRIVPATLPTNSLQARTGAIVYASDFKTTVEGAHYIYSHDGYRCSGQAFEPGFSQAPPGVAVLPWWIIHPNRHVYTLNRFRFECRVQGVNFAAEFRFYYNDNVTFQSIGLTRLLGEGAGLTTGEITLDVAADVFRVEVRITSEDGGNNALIDSVDVVPAPLNPANPW